VRCSSVSTPSADRSMVTTAEGVETEEQLAFLRQHGCSEVQGFYFSYPVPAKELRAVFERV